MLSLVIPVYRNESGIQALLEALEALRLSIDGAFEAVFVVDGSPDLCYERLRDALPTCGFDAQLVLLSRNFGAFAAIRAGLEQARGSLFAVMAADLQEPPDLVAQMFEVLRHGEADVVVAQREGRDDPLFTRLASQLFWGFYRRFVVPQMPRGGVDIFACNRPFRDSLLQLGERHSSLVAQVFWLGYRREQVLYRRRKRQHGESAWTFRKKWSYLMDSVFAFTDLPIRVLTYVGGIGSLVSGCFTALVALCRLLGVIQVPGYAATISSIAFFGTLNFFALGVVGSYAWRAYENTKERPLHVVLRKHAFSPNAQCESASRAAG